MLKHLCALALVTLLLPACGSEKREPKEEATAATREQVNDYPDITLALLEGGELPMKGLTGNNVFIFFQPDCRHCQLEAIDIEQRLDQFGDYTLYFVSSAAMDAIKAFAESFDLEQKENVRFARTSTESVLEHYGPIRTPSVYIYSDGKLKKHFNGQTDIENILEAL